MKLSILLPDSTVNYILNPSLRYDTTGWNAVGSTLTRTLDASRFGMSSLKVVTNGSALREGAYYRVNALTTVAGVGSPVTVSAYVRGSGLVRIRVIDSPAGKEWSSQKIALRSDFWQRISISGIIKGTNDVRLYVETADSVARALTFYVDGAQMELKSYPTTYCDGEQEGCTWDGLYHASTSRRNAYTRAGGRWVVLAGDQRDLDDLYVTVMGGLGMAPISNHIQDYALFPGSYFQNHRVESRPITLTFHAKHKDMLLRDRPVSLDKLHQLRQMLLDVVKPDRTAGNEDIWFCYENGAKPLYFRARYEGGLEGDWDVRNPWTNSFPLKLLAVDPFFYEDSQDVKALDFQETLTVGQFAGRKNGVWNNANYGFNGDVYDIVFGARGEIYASGAFTKANNNAVALNPLDTVNYISYYDGEKWNRMGVGANSSVLGVAVAPNGDVYAVGNFTSIGGTAANYIAKWNGSAWSALGTGLGAIGRSVAVAPNGDVYAGGEFTTAGGVTCYRIARWDGYQWRRVGQFGGLNGSVDCIAITSDGDFLYAGGVFSGEQGGGVTSSGVIKYNISTGLFSALGSGSTQEVYDLKLTNANVLYAVGEFDSVRGVAYWTGSAWSVLGSGVTPENPATPSLYYVTYLALTRSQKLYAFGTFTIMDGRSIKYLALWNGSTWVNVDIDVQGLVPGGGSAAQTGNVAVDPLTDDLYFSSEITGTAKLYCSGITTVTNPGTAEVRPIIYISGPGEVRWIENQTTRKTIYLDMMVQTNEEVMIDFGAGTIRSTIRGNLFHTMFPGSDFRSFTLAPGENKLACFMLNDVNANMTILFQPVHWSADAVQNDESL